MSEAQLKPIYGFEKYLISSEGRVFNGVRKNELRSRLDHQGYPIIIIRNSAGKKFAKKIAILVLETFMCPRPKGLVCAHLDGNRANSKLDNLAWITNKENEAHKVLHGTKTMGERHGCAKLTDAIVRKIRRFENTPENAAICSKKYNVSKETIRNILTRKTWKHI